jgi:O-methyltransferase involved in polyketide biosynthesis
VAGEEHGAPRPPLLVDAFAEDLLHQGIQARRGLVEHEQLDVGGQRGDERHLLAVALGVRAALLRRVEVEALE